jgi:HEAT repeat protein
MSFDGYGLPMDLPRPEAAIRDVGSASAEIRWIAAMSLGGADGPFQGAAVEALSILAGDPNEDVRAQAIEGLANQARFGAAALGGTTPAEWLADPSDLVRCAALANADAFGLDARASAFRSLADGSATVRAIAARALGESGERAHASDLAPLLGDPVEAVRAEAALALVRLGDERGLAITAALLGAGGEEAARATIAFGRSGMRAGAGPLRELAARRFAPNDERALAAAALARCGDDGAAEIVSRMLASRWRRSRFAAAQAIAVLPFPGAARAVAARIPLADAMEASILIQTLAAIGADEPGDALDAMRSISDDGRLGAEIAEELREAMRALVARDA